MNAKIERTKHSFMAAIIELTKTQPIDAITVTELCQVAHINRTTFYKYYAVPVDILSEAVHAIIDRIFGRSTGTSLSVEASMLVLCEHCQENRWLLNQYQSMQGQLDRIIEEAFASARHQSVERNAVHYFVAGGVSTLLVRWLREGCKQSPERMARLLAELTRNVMSISTIALTAFNE